MILLKVLSAPNSAPEIKATKSNPKIPISPQFRAPINTKISAILSTLVFNSSYKYLGHEIIVKALTSTGKEENLNYYELENLKYICF